MVQMKRFQNVIFSSNAKSLPRSRRAGIAQSVERSLMEREVSRSTPTNAFAGTVCGRDRLGSHAGHQEVSRCSTRGEFQGMCNITRTPLPSVNKAEPTLALKPRGDVTRSPK